MHNEFTMNDKILRLDIIRLVWPMSNCAKEAVADAQVLYNWIKEPEVKVTDDSDCKIVDAN